MSQVYQARFPNMTCNQCAGPIAVGQDIQRDGRKIRQDGTEGGTAWKHANPSECLAARSNPRRRRMATPMRRSTHTRRNPSTSAKLEALGKKYGTRSKAGKLAMAIAKDLKRQGH